MSPTSTNRTSDRRRFNTDGVVHIPSHLTSDTVQALNETLRQYVQNDPTSNDYGILRNNIWTEISVFRSELQRGKLAALAMSLLDCSSVICFQDNAICKPPGTSAEVNWHQDYSYWPLDRPDGITLWVSLTESTTPMGGLQYLPGTHHLGEHCPTNFIAGANQPLRPDLPALDPKNAPHPACSFDTQPGDIIAHHPLVWHMSAPNRTQQWRCAWSITFVRSTVRWSPKHAPHPFNNRLNPAEGAEIHGQLFPRFENEVDCSTRSL